MELVGIGLDVCGVGRWRRALARTPEALATAFTVDEQEWSREDPVRLALVWAAKEATVKALGCGFGGVDWKEVSIGMEGVPWMVVPTAPDMPDWAVDPEMHWCLLLCRFPGGVAALVSALRTDHSRRSCGSSGELPQPRVAGAIVPVSGYQRAPTRLARAAAERAAALQAADLAADHHGISGWSSGRTRIHRDRNGRPVIRGPDVTSEVVLASTSHCSGWAGAAIGSSRSEVDHRAATGREGRGYKDEPRI